MQFGTFYRIRIVAVFRITVRKIFIRIRTYPRIRTGILTLRIRIQIRNRVLPISQLLLTRTVFSNTTLPIKILIKTHWRPKGRLYTRKSSNFLFLNIYSDESARADPYFLYIFFFESGSGKPKNYGSERIQIRNARFLRPKIGKMVVLKSEIFVLETP